MRRCGVLASIVLALGLAAGPAAAQFQIQKTPFKPARLGVHSFVPTGTTTLKVCIQGTCREGLGSWMTVLPVPPKLRDLSYDFTWQTTVKGITSARWQVSSKPFTAAAANPPGLVAEGDAGSPHLGRFALNFSKLPPQQGGPLRFKRRGTLQPLKSGGMKAVKLLPAHYYVRVVPMFGGKPAAALSNTVRVDFLQKAPKQANPLVQLPTDVYRVQIVDFNLIKPRRLPWGCVLVTDVDPAKLKMGPASAIYQLYDGFRKSGKPFCPKPYKGMGEKKWYESLWEFSSGGVGWVSKAYEGVKKAAVKAVAKAINALPGNLCNAKCESGLMAGLNAGLVALGVPPSLPMMDDLTNQGMNYLVQVAASQAGIDCDVTCQDAIRSGIKQMAKQVEASTVSSYCDTTVAHNHGAEPICPPAGVTVKPAPESANRPARITVRVTRKPGTTTYSAVDPDRLRLSFVGTNYPGTHKFQVATNTCYTDTSVFPCDLQMLTVQGPLSAPLFNGISPELPRIAPGQSLEYSFFLTPAEYWLPGHMAMIRAKGGHVQYNDWWKLYLGAQLTVTADVECPQTVGQSMVSCAPGKAVRHVAVPTNPY